MKIRPFEPTDEEYAAVIALWNAVWPDELETVEEIKHNDASRNPERFFQRIVMEEGGTLPAYGLYVEPEWTHLPGKYGVKVLVHPDHRRRGLGSRMYEYILDQLAPRDPVKLTAGTREDQVGALAMLAKHGFKQVMRAPVSHLDVAAFDATPFETRARQVRDSGIAIRNISEIAPEDPEWQRKVYDTDWELSQDIPTTDPLTRQPYDVWCRNVYDSPGFKPESLWVALDGDRWVGMSQLWHSQATGDKLYQGITGVARSHRRRGIAIALKLKTIEFAREHGAKIIETDNEENNPMYQINLILGFTPQPGWLDFERPWDGVME